VGVVLFNLFAIFIKAVNVLSFSRLVADESIEYPHHEPPSQARLRSGGQSADLRTVRCNTKKEISVTAAQEACMWETYRDRNKG
jgi:hypothetical protein